MAKISLETTGFLALKKNMVCHNGKKASQSPRPLTITFTQPGKMSIRVTDVRWGRVSLGHLGSPVTFVQGLGLNCSQDAFCLIFLYFTRSGWEGVRQWCKCHRGRYFTAYLRNKTEGQHIQDTFASSRSYTTDGKSITDFSVWEQKSFICGDFFCPPKIPKMENSYRKLLFIQGHQNIFCCSSQKIRNKLSEYEKHTCFCVWVIFPLFGAILINLQLAWGLSFSHAWFFFFN